MANYRHFQDVDPRYDSLKRLGKGSFGEVFLVNDKLSNKKFACKEIHLSRRPHDSRGHASIIYPPPVKKKMEAMVERELRTMMKLRGHENIVEFTGDASMDTNSEKVCVYLEYYPGGDLSDVIGRHRKPIFTLTILNWAWNIAKALEACHEKGELHRDIKPVLLKYPYNHDNLLQAIDRGDNITSNLYQNQIASIARSPDSFISDCCVTDFGLGKNNIDRLAQILASTPSTVELGTPGFMAPEIRHPPADWTPACDIYSYGATLWCLCTLQQRPGDTFPPIPPSYPRELQQLITACTSREKRARPTAAAVAAGLAPLVARHHGGFLAKAPGELTMGGAGAGGGVGDPRGGGVLVPGGAVGVGRGGGRGGGGGGGAAAGLLGALLAVCCCCCLACCDD